MKLKIKNLVEKNYYINIIVRKLYVISRQLIFQMKYSKNKIEDNWIFIESFHGRNISCTPKRILQILCENSVYADFKVIVAVNDIKKYQESFENSNMILVKYNSKNYFEFISKTKYIFTNSRIPQYIGLKKEQQYIQCWHGTPLKRLGADIIEDGRNGLEKSSDIVKSYLHEGKRISYFLSPSRYASEKFITAFCLDRLDKRESILEIGYPRNDYLINIENEEIIKLKEKLGISLDKKIILYAPTFRDNKYNSKEGYIQEIAFDVTNLYETLGNQYQILIRKHYFVKENIKLDYDENFIIDVSNIDDINELYVVSDMLITDYSSVFFDYAILNKPIIFYMYDKRVYESEVRGFYLSLEELPGEIVETERDLIKAIQSPLFNIEDHEKFKGKFCYLDDGKAGERLLQKVLKNE